MGGCTVYAAWDEWSVISLVPMARELTAVFQPASGGGYIAFVEDLPGANTQGETLEEARENLREAVELILELDLESR